MPRKNAGSRLREQDGPEPPIKEEKTMKKIIALMLMCLMVLPAFALAEDAEITAQGTATVSAAPDIVRVTANASVKAMTIASAQEEMNRIISGVTTKLLELGVKEEDIVTENYSYYPSYHYDGEQQIMDGYLADHTLQITCRDVEMLDSVIGVVTDGGMTQIYNVSYDLSNREALYGEALTLAIGQAKEKAGQMAAASGLTLSHLEKLAENGGYDRGYQNAPGGAVVSAAPDATGIRAGTISVTASVTAVYEAK